MKRTAVAIIIFFMLAVLSVPVCAEEASESKKKLKIKPRITYESNLKSEELEQGNGVIAGTHNVASHSSQNTEVRDQNESDYSPDISDDHLTTTDHNTSTEEKSPTKDEAQEENDNKMPKNLPVLIGLLGAISITMMRSLKYILDDRYEQASKILKQGPGVWIPKEDRLKMLTLINSTSVTQYKITADGYLVQLGVLDRDSGKSYTISDQLNELIKGNRITVLSFSDKILKVNKKGQIYVDNVDCGITIGSVGTGKVIVLDDKDAQGNELGAVLAHELAHANATKDESEDYAIKVENAVREQLGLEKKDTCVYVATETALYHEYALDVTEWINDVHGIPEDAISTAGSKVTVFGKELNIAGIEIKDSIPFAEKEEIENALLEEFPIDIEVVLNDSGFPRPSFQKGPDSTFLSLGGKVEVLQKNGEIVELVIPEKVKVGIQWYVDDKQKVINALQKALGDDYSLNTTFLATGEAYLTDLYKSIYWEESTGSVVVNNGTTNLRLSKGDCGLWFKDGRSVINVAKLEEAFKNYRGAGKFTGIGEFFQDFENFSPTLTDFKVNAVNVKSHIASFGEPPSIVMGKEFPIEVSSANTNVLRVHIKNLDTGEKVTLEDKYVNAVKFDYWTKYKFEKEGIYEIYIEGVNTLDKGSSSTKNVATDIMKVKVVSVGASKESSTTNTNEQEISNGNEHNNRDNSNSVPESTLSSGTKDPVSEKAIDDAKRELDNILDKWNQAWPEAFQIEEHTWGAEYTRRYQREVDKAKNVADFFDTIDLASDIKSSYEESLQSTQGHPGATIVGTAVFTLIKQVWDEEPGAGELPEALGINSALNNNIARALEQMQFVNNSNYKYLVYGSDFLWEDGARKKFIEKVEELKKSYEAEIITAYAEDYENTTYKNTRLNYLETILEMNENYDENKEAMDFWVNDIEEKYS